jgi:predicted esterase
MAHEHHLIVERTARYYTLGGTPQGVPNEQTTDVWFVLHGYGQLAKYFIRRFDVLQDEKTLIVAPEGLSRLYLDAEYGKIGASWITREDRDHEIRDYVAYLDRLYDNLLADRDETTEPLRITVFGFSQGCTTACRWLASRLAAGRADNMVRLVLWAGFFPNGFADIINPASLAGMETVYVYGRQDEYIVQMDDPNGYIDRLQTELPTLKVVPFEGKHAVERDVLKQVFRNESE